MKYAPSEEWINTLGPLIVKCHIKDFKLNADGHGGEFVDIRDGSVRWPVVREALEAIGYSGFMTIEGSDTLSLARAQPATGCDYCRSVTLMSVCCIARASCPLSPPVRCAFCLRTLPRVRAGGERDRVRGNAVKRFLQRYLEEPHCLIATEWPDGAGWEGHT